MQQSFVDEQGFVGGGGSWATRDDFSRNVAPNGFAAVKPFAAGDRPKDFSLFANAPGLAEEMVDANHQIDTYERTVRRKDHAGFSAAMAQSRFPQKAHGDPTAYSFPLNVQAMETLVQHNSAPFLSDGEFNKKITTPAKRTAILKALPSMNYNPAADRAFDWQSGERHVQANTSYGTVYGRKIVTTVDPFAMIQSQAMGPGGERKSKVTAMVGFGVPANVDNQFGGGGVTTTAHTFAPGVIEQRAKFLHDAQEAANVAGRNLAQSELKAPISRQKIERQVYPDRFNEYIKDGHEMFRADPHPILSLNYVPLKKRRGGF